MGTQIVDGERGTLRYNRALPVGTSLQASRQQVRRDLNSLEYSNT